MCVYVGRGGGAGVRACVCVCVCVCVWGGGYVCLCDLFGGRLLYLKFCLLKCMFLFVCFVFGHELFVQRLTSSH